MQRVTLGAMYAGETKLAIFDFASSLSVGETLSSATAAAPVYSGGSTALTLGAPALAGTQVKVACSGGEVGTTYLLSVTATTSLATKTLSGFLTLLPKSN